MLVVGEVINATNKKVGQAIADRDKEFLQNLAKEEDAAGADFLDVNATRGGESGEEAATAMQWLIGIVQEVTDKPLVIDSDSPEVIKAGLEKYKGDKVMINSVSAEPERMEAILPLAAERQAMLVALAHGAEGIPDNVEDRVTACGQIVEKAQSLGIKLENIFFDPLVLPISVDSTQGMVTMKTIEGIKSRYPEAKTIVGLSNVSFGLPARKVVNRATLLMAAYAGLDAAILDPRDSRMTTFIKLADLLTGNDPNCKAFIKANRKGLLVE
ncbi:MAG: dihydropteroate synthase [Chloroflexota bacterium]